MVDMLNVAEGICKYPMMIYFPPTGDNRIVNSDEEKDEFIRVGWSMSPIPKPLSNKELIKLKIQETEIQLTDLYAKLAVEEAKPEEVEAPLPGVETSSEIDPATDQEGVTQEVEIPDEVSHSPIVGKANAFTKERVPIGTQRKNKRG